VYDIYIMIAGVISMIGYLLIERFNTSYCKYNRKSLIFWLHLSLEIIAFLGIQKIFLIVLQLSELLSYIIAMIIILLTSGLFCNEKDKALNK